MCDVLACLSQRALPLPHYATQFDETSDGRISYDELHDTLRRASRQTAAERKAQGLPAIPKLPRELTRRGQDVMRINKQFLRNELSTSHVPAGHIPTLEAALRLYYPQDPPAVTRTLVRYVNEVRTARAAAAEIRLAKADAALIDALDVDGNGRISLAEFCEMSTVTGLSRATMRARFRDKDLGNAGELSVEVMRELLAELRQESKARASQLRDGGPDYDPTITKGGSAQFADAMRGYETDGGASGTRRPHLTGAARQLERAAKQAGLIKP